MIIRLTSDWNERTFDSFQEAISAALPTDRTKKGKDDTARIAEHDLVDAFFTTDSAYFVLSGGLYLTVHARPRIVDWELSSIFMRPENSLNWQKCEPLECIFSQSGEHYEWDRRRLFQQLIGEPVEYLSASFSMVFFATKSRREVCFSSVCDADTGCTLLFYGFSSL